MAFCSSCGAEHAPGAAFCTSCGARLGVVATAGAAMSPESAPINLQAAMALRQDSLAEVERMQEYFGRKKSTYAKYDSLVEEISHGEAFRKRCIPLLVFGIIINLFSFIAMSEPVVGIFFFLISGGMIAGYVVINVRAFKERKKELAGLKEEFDEVTNELVTHYTQYGPCLIGMEYTNPEIIAQVKETIQKGRADTPKEAINVLLDDYHKTAMEALAVQTAVSAQHAETNSAIAAGFAAASFFLG